MIIAANLNWRCRFFPNFLVLQSKRRFLHCHLGWVLIRVHFFLRFCYNLAPFRLWKPLLPEKNRDISILQWKWKTFPHHSLESMTHSRTSGLHSHTCQSSRFFAGDSSLQSDLVTGLDNLSLYWRSFKLCRSCNGWIFIYDLQFFLGCR